MIRRPPRSTQSRSSAASDVYKRQGPRSGGVIYTRWGKSTCPNVAGTQLVYTGRAGGSHYQHAGAANYLFMPLDPQYTLRYQAGVRDHSYVYGTEYEFPLQGGQDHNVPCAVCYVSTRETVLMIPAKTSCPTSWTREYYGCLLYTSPSPRDATLSRMPSSA